MAATGVCKIRRGWGTEDSVVIRQVDGEKQEIPAAGTLTKATSPR